MAIDSRDWLESHRKELERKYDGKTVIVCEGKIVKVLNGAVNPIKVNEIAEKDYKNRNWCYSYLCYKKDYLL